LQNQSLPSCQRGDSPNARPFITTRASFAADFRDSICCLQLSFGGRFDKARISKDA
jgi:hypothetical protein